MHLWWWQCHKYLPWPWPCGHKMDWRQQLPNTMKVGQSPQLFKELKKTAVNWTIHICYSSYVWGLKLNLQNQDSCVGFQKKGLSWRPAKKKMASLITNVLWYISRKTCQHAKKSHPFFYFKNYLGILSDFLGQKAYGFKISRFVACLRSQKSSLVRD